MWTDTTRAKHARKGLRYSSDLTDAEWSVLEGGLPGPKRLGRPRKWSLREIVNAQLYILRSGQPWRMLPKDFPPLSTVQRYFYAWRGTGLWNTINHLLLMAVREAIGREASPSAGVIDSQSVKTTEAGGPSGYDAGKKIKGRKRHILTDTEGFLVGAVIHEADIQDRDGAPCVLAAIRTAFPWLRHIFADGAYAGDKLKAALAGKGDWTSKSSSDPTPPRASRSCRGVGSWSAPSHGSAETADLPRTSREPSRAPPHGSSWLPSSSSPAESLPFPPNPRHSESDS